MSFKRQPAILRKSLLTVFGASISMLFVSACTTQSQSGPEMTAVSLSTETPIPSKVNVNAHPLSKTVCDPFDGNSSETFTKGLKGTLYYKLANQPIMYTALENTSLTYKSNQNLFFADINVPTRYFTEGFLTQTNDVLLNDQQEKLIEYFGIKYQSALALSSQDEEGVYEIASLSDDGAVMKIFENGQLTDFINNDGDHPSKLGCTSQRVTMTRNTVIPFELRYYQGPRTHISNMLLWRKVDAMNSAADPLCDQYGDDFWFDWQNGSLPTLNFLQLVQRGWKVIGKDNFWIVNSAGNAVAAPAENGILNDYNPCVDGVKPVISEFGPYEIFFNAAIFRWVTDLPSTSQVFVTNKQTGERVETLSDNMLRTQHLLNIQNLSPGTTYQVQALSISQSLGVTLSEVIEFTTL